VAIGLLEELLRRRALDPAARQAPEQRGGVEHLERHRDELGLDSALDFHSLRRSHVTHLIEAGWDAFFVQCQVGHEASSTTALYTCVSSDFRTRTLRRALDQTMDAALRGDRRT
jgi:site-specific recombinase XerD